MQKRLELNKMTIESVRIDVTNSHPSTQIKEAYFIIEFVPTK